MNYKSFSISFWCTLKSSSFTYNIILGYDNSGYTVSTLTGALFIYFSDPDTIIMQIMAINDQLIYSSGSSFTNQINFWCFTFDIYNNYKMTMYLNGLEVATYNAYGALNIVSNPGQFSLGRNYFNGSSNFIYGNIVLDDFRVYTNKVFTSQEVNELYTGRVDIYNLNSNILTSNYSSNLIIKGDLNISGNIKLNNIPLNLNGNNINYSISGTGNSINTAIDDSNYIYAMFTSNGTFTIYNDILCDILIVGGGGGGGYDGAGGGGGGQVLYYTNNNVSFKTGNSITLKEGTYNINIGLGGIGSTKSGTITQAQAQTINGTNGGDSSIINAITAQTFLAKGGGGGASRNNIGNGGNVGGAGGTGHAYANKTTSATSTNNGGRGGYSHITNNGGGGGGGGANIVDTSKNGNNAVTFVTKYGGNGGIGANINITGIIIGVGGGGGGGSPTNAGGFASHGGGAGNLVNNITEALVGKVNTGGGGGSGGHSVLGTGNGKNGGTGVVIIRFNKYQNYYNGILNYSNVQSRPYLLDLLTSSNLINVEKGNNINFPLSITSWKNEWFLYIGTSPLNNINSFIFNHLTSTINSKWWFNGTVINTNAEISDYRIKNNIQDISNGIDKLMLLKPKEGTKRGYGLFSSENNFFILGKCNTSKRVRYLL